MHIQDIQDATQEQLEEIERQAYNAGNHPLASMAQKCIGLLIQNEALEDEINNTETLKSWEDKYGPAKAYYDFFHECFDYLPKKYPYLNVETDYDKSVIFDAIKGEPLKEALYQALPFVEDCENSTDFKPGAVTKIIKEIRQALGLE
jgi:hypothetical protein